MKIHISGVGCSLIDYLYTGIDFSSDVFRSLMSRKAGDGGLVPGNLVFTSDLERFSGKKLSEILSAVNGDTVPASVNLGGPAVVALIHVAQMLPEEVTVDFIGSRGKDKTGEELVNFINRTPLNIRYYKISSLDTPRTIVLSDSAFNNGKGERTFINTIGAAGELSSEDIPETFYDSDICVFGGTALTPRIHDDLTDLLRKAKARKALTVVNTVYDFRNEAANPGKPWPLGDKKRSYPLIDLLIADMEEALRISGTENMEQAMEHFISGGVKTAIITHGSDKVHVYADGSVFEETSYRTFPVSARIDKMLESGLGAEGDTTGCGDNFVGGVLASMAKQLTVHAGGGPLKLKDAVAWGNVSGGWACFYKGGTYFEKVPGEKLKALIPIVEAYFKQMELNS